MSHVAPVASCAQTSDYDDTSTSAELQSLGLHVKEHLIAHVTSGQAGDAADDPSPVSPVSTGHLPAAERILGLVEAAYERFKVDDTGRNADHYPALAAVPRTLFGVCVAGTEGALYAAGDADYPFTIMSVAKPFVFALVDTSTARMFVTRRGVLREVAGADDDSYLNRQRNTGGLNHKRYQRRVQNRRVDFAREMAVALEAIVAHEGATRVILAGDDVAIPRLHEALSPQLEPLVSEQVVRLDIRTPRTDVQREIAPLLAQIEEDESHGVATRLIDAVREQGLGVIGAQETKDALEHGQAETLVLAGEAPLAAHERNERNELVHLAAVTGASAETVQGHEALQAAGGVGALLRYRLSWV